MNFDERRELERRWAKGDSAVSIARDLGFSNQTIYTEILRGRDGTLDANMRYTYKADIGQRIYMDGCRARGRKKKVEE